MKKELKEAKDRARSNQIYYMKNKRKNIVTKKCVTCEKLFKYSKSYGTRKYCSVSCGATYQWDITKELTKDFEHETWMWYWDVRFHKQTFDRYTKRLFQVFDYRLHNEKFDNNKAGNTYELFKPNNI